MIRRRHLALTAAALPFVGAASQTTDWPNRPLRFVSAFPPGGAADLLTRVMADEMRGPLEQPVTVENSSGVGGTVGSEFLARAAPDGTTWLMASIGPFSITPELAQLNFDPARDLAPVAMVAGVTSVFAVHPSVPANTLAELIRVQPGRLS